MRLTIRGKICAMGENGWASRVEHNTGLAFGALIESFGPSRASQAMSAVCTKASSNRYLAEVWAKSEREKLLDPGPRK